MILFPVAPLPAPERAEVKHLNGAAVRARCVERVFLIWPRWTHKRNRGAKRFTLHLSLPGYIQFFTLAHQAYETGRLIIQELQQIVKGRCWRYVRKELLHLIPCSWTVGSTIVEPGQT